MERNVVDMARLRGRFAVTSLAAGVMLRVAAACGGSAGEAKPERICTPGNYVFCRCEDRREGTKLCNPEGTGFAACDCEGVVAPRDPFEGLPERDGGLHGFDGPVEPTAPAIEAACVDRLGVVAGRSDDDDVYVATYKGDGAFQVGRSTGPAVRSAPAMVAVGPALVAAWRSRTPPIVWSKMLLGTWSAPEIIAQGAMTSRAVAAATFLGTGKLVYVDADGNLRVGTYGTSGGWDGAIAYLGNASPDAGADGKSDPVATTLADGAVLVAWSTAAGSVLSRTLSAASRSWLVPRTVVTSGAFQGPVSLTAIEGSPSEDALLVYADEDLTLRAVARDLGTNVWRSRGRVDDAAVSIEHRLVTLPGGRAMLVYLGANDAAFVSVYTAGAGFSPPRELVAGQAPLAAVPSLTRGRCGSEVTLAYAEKATGTVSIMRYGAAAWSGPHAVPIPRASWVGVGETP